MYNHICTYAYIYIEREREIDVYIHIKYIYIYIYICHYYIITVVSRGGSLEAAEAQSKTATRPCRKSYHNVLGIVSFNTLN